MRKYAYFLIILTITAIAFAQQPTCISNGYRFKLFSLEYFDYNKRFKDRQVLGSAGEYPCIKGKLTFLTPLDETPTAIKNLAAISNAQSDKNTSLLLEQDEEEQFIKNYSNTGMITFYLEIPRKKEGFISSLAGKAYFKIPERTHSVTIKKTMTCPWFPINQGQACILIFKDDPVNTAEVILKFSSANKQNTALLKLFIVDTETNEKNVLWHHYSFKDSKNNDYHVYQTNIFFEKKDNFYFLINDKDYEIPAVNPEPFPSLNDTNAFLVDETKDPNYSRKVYMITLPKNRPVQNNWAYVNLGSKQNNFSLPVKDGLAQEKKALLFREFTKLPNKYTIDCLGLFQVKNFKIKTVPFTFSDVPLPK